MNEDVSLQEPAGNWGAALVGGLIWACLVGVAMGWLRYWLGLFVLAQGAVVGALVARLVRGRLLKAGKSIAHPGFGPACGLAGLWTLAFWLGLLAGLALAHPWWDSLGWLGRVLAGRSTEYVFGLAGAYVLRGFEGGAKGFFWVVLNFIDLAIMFFFFVALPWGKDRKTGAGEIEQ